MKLIIELTSSNAGFGGVTAEIYIGKTWIKEIGGSSNVKKLLECIAENDDLIEMINEKLNKVK